MKNEKRYTEEFKQQIADLYKQGNKSISVLENEYGVSRTVIHGWIKKYCKIEIDNKQSVTMAEYKKLQKKNKQLEMENEIFKKSTAIFAQETQKKQ